MPEANIISEHMEVIGSDGVHVGTVDHVDGNQIKLTKAGASDGEHHFVPTAIVQDIRGNVVTLTKSGDEALGEAPHRPHSAISEAAAAIDENDIHKTEKLTKLGHQDDEKSEGNEDPESKK